MFVVRELLS